MKWLQKFDDLLANRYTVFCRHFPRLSRFLGFIHRRRGPLKAITLLFAHLLGFYFSVQAVMQARTEQGAAAWAIALNTIPVLSVPGWLVFGDNKVTSYQTTKRVGMAEVRPLADRFISSLGKLEPDSEKPVAAGSLRETLDRLGRIGSLPAVPGNRATLLVNGEATYDAILKGIDEAKKYILVARHT